MLRLQNFGFDAAAGLPPTCHGFAPATRALALALGKGSCASRGEAVLYKASEKYLTATITGLVVAILLSPTATASKASRRLRWTAKSPPTPEVSEGRRLERTV